MPKDFPPIVSNVSISPAFGTGGTVYIASVVASDFPPMRIDYQWRLDGVDIVGAMGPSHIATAAGQLSVLAKVTNDHGSATRESAAVSVARPFSAPEVTEARIEPSTGAVGGRFGVIADATGVPVPDLDCQWFLDGAPIAGATAMTYSTIAPGRLSARVTGRNPVGSHCLDTEAVDLATGSIAPTVLAVGVNPNGGRVGDVFAVTSQVAGSPVPALSYQWFLDGTAIQGATGASQLAGGAGLLSVRATATNQVGTDSRESAGVIVATGLVAPVVDAVDILPDTGRVGDTFTAFALVSGDPEPELRFEWILDDLLIAGAVGNAHVPAEAGMLRVRVVASNSEGEAVGESDPFRVEPARVSPKLAEVAIAPETGRAGDTFEVSATVTGDPVPEMRYQWFLDGAAIAGATGQNHLADTEGLLSVQVTATNSEGSDSVGASVVVQAVGAPVAEAGSHVWTERAGTGVRTYDAGARFTVPGEPAKATVTYQLLSGGGGGPFEDGVLEEGTYVPLGEGYVTINATEGVLSIDTNTSGQLDGATITVRASNDAGYGDLTIALSVSAAGAGERLSDVQISGTGACWTAHKASFRLDGALIEGEGDLPMGATVEIEWRRNGTPIGGADGWSYMPVFADDPTNLSVHAKVTIGSDEPDGESDPLAITNPNLIQNPGFDDTSVWSLGTGWAITGGQAVKSGSTNAAGLRQAISMTSGYTYRCTFNIVVSGAFAWTATGGGTDSSATYNSGVGVFSRDVTLTGNRTTFNIINYANSQNPTIDNVVLKRIA